MTSVIGLSCQPFLLYQIQVKCADAFKCFCLLYLIFLDLSNFDCYINISFQNSGTGSLGVAAAGGAFFSFFTFATPLLIHWVSKKYVTELLYNKIEDSYTAITYSLLLKKKKVSLILKSSKSKLKS